MNINQQLLSREVPHLRVLSNNKDRNIQIIDTSAIHEEDQDIIIPRSDTVNGKESCSQICITNTTSGNVS